MRLNNAEMKKSAITIALNTHVEADFPLPKPAVGGKPELPRDACLPRHCGRRTDLLASRFV